MPVYEYVCLSCEKHFDLIVNSETEIVCEFCGSNKVEKQISLFAAHTSSSSKIPECSHGCGDGFTHGTCGSGMCSTK